MSHNSNTPQDWDPYAKSLKVPRIQKNILTNMLNQKTKSCPGRYTEDEYRAMNDAAIYFLAEVEQALASKCKAISANYARAFAIDAISKGLAQLKVQSSIDERVTVAQDDNWTWEVQVDGKVSYAFSTPAAAEIYAKGLRAQMKEDAEKEK